MRLATKRLILRPITIKDTKSIAKNANDPEIFYFTSSVPYPYSLKDAKKFIKHCKKEYKKKPRENYEFGIELKSEKRIVGMISLVNINKQHKKAVIGYWLGKKYRRQGIVTEAEKVILDFGFKKLKLNKIYGECVIENKSSVRLFKKFGFRKVGIEREELIRNNKKLGIKNKKLDAFRWELLRKDYKPKKL